MMIFWIRKNDKGEAPRNTEESFRKHDEHMKKFRVDHPIEEGTGTKDLKWTESMALVRFPPVKLNSNMQN